MSSANLLAKPRSSSPTEAPVSCAAWYNLSDLLDEQGRSEAAIDCLRKALGAAPATLLATDGEAASNRWCAVTPKRSENCGYATLDQCRAYMLGLGGWCRPNPFPGTAFGTSGTWSSGPPRQNRGGY
jgi:tetratricopeptide (TPR) repeat protein